MDESYRVGTPENVELSFTPAGLATRFLAAAIDSIIIGVALMILLVFTVAIYFSSDALGQVVTTALVAIMVLLIFALFFGYYIVFETVWSGQSPGKRLLGLRVIRDDGLPLNFTASVARNLVRLVDILPSAYVFGVVAMFLNKRWKRLGDMAAGTLVVLDRAAPAPTPMRFSTLDELQMAPFELLRPLTAEEYDLGREYLIRYYTLSEEARESVGRSLAEIYEARTGVERGAAEPWRYINAVLSTSQQDGGRPAHRTESVRSAR